MKQLSHPALFEATRLTRAGRLTEATALLQRALSGDAAPAPAAEPASGLVLDLVAETVETGETPRGGSFTAHAFASEAGHRDYKLYRPGGERAQDCPLVVMLHGCTQSPDDFAAGTRMNALADERRFLVAYPAQSAAANASRCWNWFKTADQQRDRGEPALIAGITRRIMGDHAIDPRRVYIAGLSAGGAAAAVMGATYPDLYAAIGVHSGLPCGAAGDLGSAFAAMQAGQSAKPPRPSQTGRPVPTIVFHGDKDVTVNPRNGDQVIAQLLANADLRRQVERGQVPGGHAFSRTQHVDANGLAVLEQWLVHGAGHAWSGGSAAGSYTDPRGPDATREMLRFFMEHTNMRAG